MYKRERQQIARLYGAVHRIQNIRLLEFMMLTQKHGISMMNYYKMMAKNKDRMSKMTPKPRATQQARYAKKVMANGRELSKLSHDLAIIEMSVLLGGVIKGKKSSESIATAYKDYIEKAATSPFKYNPADSVWDDMNNPKQVAKMKAIISSGIIDGKPRRQVIDDLETFLRVDRSYPRWLQSRISQLSPPRVGNPTGLLKKAGNKTVTGFAYRAYRMYNTQYAEFNANLNTTLASKNPFITHKNVVLSPFHPFCDSCNKASRKTWKVEDNPLPIHPNCLCYYANRVSDKSINEMRKQYQVLKDGRNGQTNELQRVNRIFGGLDIVRTGALIMDKYLPYMG